MGLITTTIDLVRETYLVSRSTSVVWDYVKEMAIDHPSFGLLTDKTHQCVLCGAINATKGLLKLQGNLLANATSHLTTKHTDIAKKHGLGAFTKKRAALESTGRPGGGAKSPKPGIKGSNQDPITRHFKGGCTPEDQKAAQMRCLCSPFVLISFTSRNTLSAGGWCIRRSASRIARSMTSTSGT